MLSVHCAELHLRQLRVHTGHLADHHRGDIYVGDVQKPVAVYVRPKPLGVAIDMKCEIGRAAGIV